MCPTLAKEPIAPEKPLSVDKRALIRSAALHGITAWLAYAVIEFLCTSLPYRLIRRYAVFTVRHWTVLSVTTGLYLVAGVMVGFALAGLAYLTWPAIARRKSPAVVLEWGASLSIIAAFAVNLATLPSHEGTATLWVATALLGIAGVASVRSDRWCARFGALGNPWVVTLLLLTTGRLTLLQQMDVKGMLARGR